ncbi:MAG: hypothetical protein ACD_46C00643G0002 [uncultured bacterium]|nr:MAG: hypothetical protein ACD_46C00643G0002 [uncultured bacterium]
MFEIVSEFIALYQIDGRSDCLKDRKEVNVANFKEMIFKTVPNLIKKFDLGDFTPDLHKLKDYFRKADLDFEKFKDYSVDAVDFYIKNYLFNGRHNDAFFRNNFDIHDYENICPHFMGHILHRIIRKLNRYPDFHVNFDTFKAIKIWNYWNKNSILFPYNSIIPKGEIGINPAFPELEYKVYSTNVISESFGDVCVVKDKEINVKITPQLIEIKKLLMRKK